MLLLRTEWKFSILKIVSWFYQVENENKNEKNVTIEKFILKTKDYLSALKITQKCINSKTQKLELDGKWLFLYRSH